MAAGLGFKNFASGEVLTAADVNAYLNSQTVMVFADATARTAAITSPQEGMFSYLKDTNATQYYTGSAWTNLDTTGMVNPMTTTGDTIYSSSGTTPARLGIGTTGQVLTVAGGVPSWANPAGGGKVKQVVTMTYSTQKVSSTDAYADTGLELAITPTSASNSIYITWNMYCGKLNDAANAALGFKTFRDATLILDDSGYSYLYTGTTLNLLGGITRVYKDSPATTSSTTYKVQYNNQANSGTVRVNYGGTVSTISLFEIEA